MTDNNALERKPNKLINEKSPYLLRHAYNLVNWYPWGEEAFQKAKSEDKIILLSIGYSTCHWCHEMERESFDDYEVAQILNENYVAIKVDKEERPDIDSIYMMACKIMTTNGGWPLTILMTPDQKPFFANTYLPKRKNSIGNGLIELLELMSENWKSNKQEIINLSENITTRLNSVNFAWDKEEIKIDHIHDCYEKLEKMYDKEFGGFSPRMKFPMPHYLMFLMEYYKTFKNENALNMVEKTLICMYKGGIYDHIGKGFAKQSGDKAWMIPHFEKLLCDNALLAYVYAEAYDITKRDYYKKIAMETINYAIRELGSKQGGFYSAQDAESEEEDGKFYVWSLYEIEDILGEEDSKKYIEAYKITEGGNFYGKNIINLVGSNIFINQEIEAMNEKLYQHRDKREHPFLDDKILTSWNGLMIAALAHCGKLFNIKEYYVTADNIVEFIILNLMDDEGKVYTRFRDGEKSKDGYLDDYAFFVWGLIELYEATEDTKYLKKAVKINDKMLSLFEDKGGLFISSNESEKLLIRTKELIDGLMPTGNSVAIRNMLKLAKLADRKDLKGKAEDIVKSYAVDIKTNSALCTFLNISILDMLKK